MTKRFWRSAAAAAIVFVLQGCTPKGQPIVSLETPSFVPQSPPDSVYETGIRQDPQTGGIVLQWYMVPGAAYYKVFRSDTITADGIPMMFSPIGDVQVSPGLDDTSMVDVGSVKTGTRYYYFMKAYSADGSSSPGSDTINYLLLDRPELSYPINGSLNDINSLQFGWRNLSGGYSVVRVEDLTLIPWEYVWVSHRFQTFEQYPSKSYDFDSTASQQLVSGHSYRWRVSRFNLGPTGKPYEGSSSPWATFGVK